MADKKRFYELSTDADYDLEDIFDYTEKEFGFDQAVFYVDSLVETIESIPSNPKMGRERDEIKNKLHSLLHGKHLIFYRVLLDRIRIVKILHGNRDLPRYF